MADILTVTPQDRIVDPARPAGAPNLPVMSAVETASEAARATLANKGTAVPAEIPRNANGQFIEPGRVDSARELGTNRQAPAPEGGQPAPVPAVPPVEGQPAPEVVAPVEGEQTDEAVVEETPEEKTARELDERTVTLPGRNNSELDFIAPDKETADVLRQLRNSSMRGEEIAQARAEIEGRAQQYEALDTILEASPLLYLRDRVTDPETLADLALYAITRPEVFQRIGTQLQQIATNAQVREMVSVKQENKLLNQEREVVTLTEERAAVRQNLEEVRTTVMSLIPASLSDEQSSILYRDCLRDLRDYANRHGLQTLPGRDIPALLATRLTAYGINPVEAAARAADATTRRAALPAKRPAPTSPRVPAVPAKPAAAAPTGAQLVLSQKRRAAVAIPPAGAGSPPATTPMTPPKNADGTPMTIEQRVAWHRQQVNAGSKRL